MIDIAAAQVFCRKLSRTSSQGYRLRAIVVPREEWLATLDAEGRCRRAYVPTGKVVFQGGLFGEHSIELFASDEARILAHWEGYCEASGMLRPAVGQTASFPCGSASSMGGWRTGRVIKVGPRRVQILFRYKISRREAIRTVPLTLAKWEARTADGQASSPIANEVHAADVRARRLAEWMRNR